MSLNHIIDSNTSNNDPLNLVCKSLKFPSDSPFNSNLSSSYSHDVTAQILNETNDEVLGSTTLYYSKVGEICTIMIQAFTSTQLSVGGSLKINTEVPEVFWQKVNNDVSVVGAKTRTADYPLFKPEAIVRLPSSDHVIRIVNVSNAGNYPNGENVILDCTTLVYTGNQ